MSLEGTLDAFGLADVFQLLSATRKTGTLHLRAQGAHGAVHLRDGQVTGARADVQRQALVRRLVGAGLVDDRTFAEQVAGHPPAGLARVLAERAGLEPRAARELAAEQATDAVFDLLRWPDGVFTFVADEADPDDLGAALPVDEVVAEGRRRLAEWERCIAAVPTPDAVVQFAAAPTEPPLLSPQEWQLLALVDGRRAVAELVELSGRGDFAVVSALAGLVERGLLEIGSPDAGVALLRRQELLDGLEGTAHPAPTALADRRTGPAPAPDLTPGGVHGSSALAVDPRPQPAPVGLVQPDPGIDKTLLLRLIAGVKGL